MISKAQVAGMKSGAVIVDLSADGGGNCEASIPGETTVVGGVTIVAPLNVPSRVGPDASELYAKNPYNLLALMMKDNIVNIDWSDEVLAKTALTHDGKLSDAAPVAAITLAPRRPSRTRTRPERELEPDMPFDITMSGLVAVCIFMLAGFAGWVHRQRAGHPSHAADVRLQLRARHRGVRRPVRPHRAGAGAWVLRGAPLATTSLLRSKLGRPLPLRDHFPKHAAHLPRRVSSGAPLMPQSVLVVGGAGYIGSHTCLALRAEGYEPVVFDDLSLGHESFVQWGDLVRGDVRNVEDVRKAVCDYSTDAVIHFAALAYVGESVVHPSAYYETNVVGVLRLLDALRQEGSLPLVFSSTCAVYGAPEALPITELTPTKPVNPYGRTKLVAEGMLTDFARAYDQRYTILRYFNASGADAMGRIGELRSPETHLIPRAMMAIQGHIDDFEVFGSDFETPDGTAIRDYIHVSDLAQAHVVAVRRLLDGGSNGVYNLGAGRGWSVAEVLAAISRRTGQTLAPPRGARRQGDPATLVADTREASAHLGFNPKFSDLPTIIDSAWNWHLKAHPAR